MSRKYWNYRVMTVDGGKTFGIHEVYYDKDIPTSYTENHMSPSGESLGELIEDLQHMFKAFAKPILTPADFPQDV